jgi:hypothetical protein
MTALIRLNDGEGPLVEVDMNVPAAQLASSGTVIKVVSRGFEEILNTLRSVVIPFAETWREISKEVEITESTVKLSLGITAEGNFFVAKGDAKANIEIALKLTPKPIGLKITPKQKG